MALLSSGRNKVDAPAVAPARLRGVGIVAGVFLGALGVVAFGVIHAVAIVPIWDRLAPGIAFAVPSGALLGWSAAELQHAARGPRPARWLSWGYGVLVWSALLPALVLDNVLRLLSVNAAVRDRADIAALLLTALTATGIVHRMVRARRATASFVIATCGLLAASGGPIPVVNGRPAWELFLGVSMLWMSAGAALGQIVYKANHPSVRVPSTPDGEYR